MRFIWIVFAFLAAVYILIGIFVFLVAYVRRFPIATRFQSSEVRKLRQTYAPQLTHARDYTSNLPQQQLCLTARDGIRLHAVHIPAGENSRGVILMIHGFRAESGPYDMCCAMEALHDDHWDVVVPDLRGHGKSGGAFLGFAAADRFDVCDWCHLIDETLHPKNLFLDGISMGAATVLGTSELPLPDCMRGIIADCGFTDAHSQMKQMIHARLHIPALPALLVTSLLARIFTGYGLWALDTTRALQHNCYPVFFAHGERDGFVSCDMTRRNYAACTAEKEVLYVPNAGHGASFLVEHEEYLRRLRAFLARYEKKETTI